MIHITNQAYQETSELFGKFEEGNTLLLEDFMKYLQEEYGKKKGKELYNSLVQDWKEISKLIIERTWNVINKKTKEVPNRRYYELIGLDYMIDEDFNTWLIEANFNPSLNDKTIWGREIVPQVLEETIEICVDPIFKEDRGKIPKKLKWFEQI
jgi:tubulin monoglycylase TTLL3/8